MKETITIPLIELGWNKWYKWKEVKDSIDLSETSGVYEPKYEDTKERLTIG